MNSIVPISRIPVSVRPATLDDLSFVDALQKKTSKQVGFMQTKALEGKIKLGHVIVAEEDRVSGIGCRVSGEDQTPLVRPNPETRTPKPDPVGYCIGNDQYYKRDDLGVIFQLNVVPGKRRSLIGATLIKAMFDRAAYGCRLFCCWCAQDLDANYFWESLGFVPLAFRAGAKGKRAHIFWQRRIREGDATTPYWFPAKTDGGMMREDRLVLPIPPGAHWKDPMPILIPEAQKALPEQTPKRAGERQKPQKTPRLMPPPTRRGARFGPPPAEHDIPAPVVEKAKPQKKKRQKVNADPAHVAKARELRDRYLEHVNSGQLVLASAGKYDVSRQLISDATPFAPKLIAAAYPTDSGARRSHARVRRSAGSSPSRTRRPNPPGHRLAATGQSWSSWSCSWRLPCHAPVVW